MASRTFLRFSDLTSLEVKLFFGTIQATVMAFDMRGFEASVQEAIDATADNSQARRELQQILLKATTATRHPMDIVYTLLHEVSP